jgi:hypothetical protein
LSRRAFWSLSTVTGSGVGEEISVGEEVRVGEGTSVGVGVLIGIGLAGTACDITVTTITIGVGFCIAFPQALNINNRVNNIAMSFFIINPPVSLLIMQVILCLFSQIHPELS